MTKAHGPRLSRSGNSTAVALPLRRRPLEASQSGEFCRAEILSRASETEKLPRSHNLGYLRGMAYCSWRSNQDTSTDVGRSIGEGTF